MHHRTTALCVCLSLLTSACATVTQLETPEGPVAVVVGHPPALPPVPEPPPPPPPPPPKAVVTATMIELREPVEFTDAQSGLVEEAGPVLDEVVELLHENAWIQKLSIEVHASGAGTEDENLALTEARAVAIQTYLVERGIDQERIAVLGHAAPRSEPGLDLRIVEGVSPDNPADATVEVETAPPEVGG